MYSWIGPLLLLLALGDTPATTLEPAPKAGEHTAAIPHDFHVSFARMAIEGTMAVVRIRMFKDDLNQALTFREERDIFVDASPVSDSLFQAYFNEMVVLRSDDEIMAGSLVGSGEEVVGNEPMWWYLLEFRASETIENLFVSQRLLSELFEDQKNIVQVQHFPSEKTYSLYCAEDAWEYTMSFLND